MVNSLIQPLDLALDLAARTKHSAWLDNRRNKTILSDVVLMVFGTLAIYVVKDLSVKIQEDLRMADKLRNLMNKVQKSPLPVTGMGIFQLTQRQSNVLNNQNAK